MLGQAGSNGDRANGATARGVRQGCSLFLLFVLVVELLAKKKIRHNEEIKGILKDSAVKDDLKLLQYADDMTLLLKHESDLKEALAKLDSFSKISGLKLNKKKSLGMWVGSHKKQAVWEGRNIMD